MSTEKKILRTIEDITDPPDGMCWKCPDCETWTTLPENARFHFWKENHALPTLIAIPPTPPKVEVTEEKLRAAWDKAIVPLMPRAEISSTFEALKKELGL